MEQEEPTSWVGFLRKKAAQGDEAALAVLRSDKIPMEPEKEERFDFEGAQAVRDKWRQTRADLSAPHKYGIKRRGLLAVAKAHELAELEKLDPNAPALFAGFTSDIDARGTVMIKLASGGMIRDSGQEIRFSAHDRTAKAAAMLFAQSRWGQDVCLEGNQICRIQEPEIAMVKKLVAQQAPDRGRGR